jgi:uncharacterized protein (DUF2236 family)
MKREWTYDDRQYLIKYYPTVDNELLAQEMNRGISSIVRMANLLGIKKTVPQIVVPIKQKLKRTNNFSLSDDVTIDSVAALQDIRESAKMLVEALEHMKVPLSIKSLMNRVSHDIQKEGMARNGDLTKIKYAIK